MQQLEFLQTVSAAEFKAAQGVSKMDILRNESTGKCFFTFGSQKGAVTNKYPAQALTAPMVSQVMSNDTGDVFYLLHNKGEGGATKMQSL